MVEGKRGSGRRRYQLLNLIKIRGSYEVAHYYCIITCDQFTLQEMTILGSKSSTEMSERVNDYKQKIALRDPYRLLEDTYTNEEVQEILNNLCKIVQTDVERELMNTSHSNVILLKQIFKQAEKWHLRLQVDLAQLENKEVLECIKSLDDENAGIFPEKGPPSPNKGKLQPLGDIHGSVKLLNLEIERLKNENLKLKNSLAIADNQLLSTQEDVEKLENNLSGALKQLQEFKNTSKEFPQCSDMKEVQGELEQIKYQLDHGKEHALAEQLKLQEELNDAKQLINEAQAQLQLAEQELERKFSETVVYKNMKKMLEKKNDLIKELRSQLQDTPHIVKEKFEN